MNKIKAAVANAKTHVVDHKELYITGGVCLVVGVLSGAVIMSRRPTVSQDSEITQKICWKPNATLHTTNTTVINFIERSTPSKPVHLVGTQKYWDGVRAAARDTGHTASEISKNANGHRPHVKGDVFEFVKPDSQ